MPQNGIDIAFISSLIGKKSADDKNIKTALKQMV